MTAHAEIPERPWGRNLAIAAVFGVFVFAWGVGTFDRFFAQQGLDFMVMGTCIRTLANTLVCGTDEIGQWCQQFGTLNADNQTICAGY